MFLSSFARAFIRVLAALVLVAGITWPGAPVHASTEGTGSISGKVTSAAGLSVNRLPVTLTRTSDRLIWDTKTAADGSYTVNGLPAGSYEVWIYAGSGGGHNTWYGGTTRELATLVSVAPGQAVAGIDVDLPLGGTISGKVSVPEGFTFERIFVHSHGEEPGESGPFAEVDAQGNYLIKGLAPDQYTLYFYPHDPDLVPTYYGGVGTQPPARISITGTEAVTGVDAALRKAAVIEGKLTLPEGATTEGLTVSARSLNNDLAGIGTVKPDSSFRITALDPGSYRVKVSAGATGLVDQWFSNGSTPGSATGVTVRAEETIGGIDLTLARAPAFSDIADGDLFSQDIQWLAARGVTEGFPDNTYKPLDIIHRDAMAAFLYRVAGRPEFVPPSQSPFHDVSPGAPFYKEITWFRSAGITTGYEDGTFRPQGAVNRDAMAAFLRRFSNKISCIRPQEEFPVFTDNPGHGPFAVDIAWMSCFDISTGFPDGSYRPTEPVRRDAMAAFLKRWSVNPGYHSGLS